MALEMFHPGIPFSPLLMTSISLCNQQQHIQFKGWEVGKKPVDCSLSRVSNIIKNIEKQIEIVVPQNTKPNPKELADRIIILIQKLPIKQLKFFYLPSVNLTGGKLIHKPQLLHYESFIGVLS